MDANDHTKKEGHRGGNGLPRAGLFHVDPDPDARWTQEDFPSAPHTQLYHARETAVNHACGAAFRFRAEVTEERGRGFRDYISFSNDLRVLLSDFEYKEETRGKADGVDLLKFHFKLTGKNRVCFNNRDEILAETGSSVVAFHPKGLLKDDWYAAKARERSLTLCCSPAQLAEALHLDADELPKPIKNYMLDGAVDFFVQQLPLTARMTRVIEDMMNPPYGRQLRHIHAEARSLDLICIILDLLSGQSDDDGGGVRLSRKDVEALNGVRDYLRYAYADPPRMPQLSCQFGLNRTKMAEGFKFLFGETVFEHIQRLRMERARELLLETDWPLWRVGEAVGYDRQSSFSAAFRVRYGYAPKTLRAKR